MVGLFLRTGTRARALTATADHIKDRYVKDAAFRKECREKGWSLKRTVQEERNRWRSTEGWNRWLALSENERKEWEEDYAASLPAARKGNISSTAAAVDSAAALPETAMTAFHGSGSSSHHAQAAEDDDSYDL